MPSSDQLGQHVTFVRDELRYAGGDFTEFYFDLLLDIQGLAPAFAPGGFLYTTSKGRKIFLRADFNQITSLSKASDGKDIEKIVNLGTVNGFRVPARIQYSEGSYNRTIFYEFDEQSIAYKERPFRCAYFWTPGNKKQGLAPLWTLVLLLTNSPECV